MKKTNLKVPQEIVSKIFQYDNTFLENYNKVLHQIMFIPVLNELDHIVYSVFIHYDCENIKNPTTPISKDILFLHLGFKEDSVFNVEELRPLMFFNAKLSNITKYMLIVNRYLDTHQNAKFIKKYNNNEELEYSSSEEDEEEEEDGDEDEYVNENFNPVVAGYFLTSVI